jgi:N-acetylglucosaminyldiphosphoundecaprenol N-acetyl-beta-D-mannosaminyltransferase
MLDNFIGVMGCKVFSESLDKIEPNEGKIVINTINPHSYVTAKKDVEFKIALQDSDILIPDGSGIVLAAKLINGDKINKIAGADLHKHLLGKLNMIGGSAFYMGASQATLDKIKVRLFSDFPNVNVGTYSPPFKESFTDDDNVKIIEKINSFKPDVLFIGMTAPKQEKWVHQNKEKLNFKVACSIGAVFDFYAGNTKRAPQWMIDFGLEWLHRSLLSWRLAKRNFISNPIFIKDMMLEKFK